ncbi:zinc finger BED domain-containing protein 4-like [Culex pipiens pallens]|uniref:zinc finger BED domain-containing protein 4-like n=1 Tax=Culex pipiens pallens TaxID=42434 RepID=UPI0022AADF4B|nr:zinc finger BED domain-containing protein 4-like [Culex pipiens pallens]
MQMRATGSDHESDDEELEDEGEDQNEEIHSDDDGQENSDETAGNIEDEDDEIDKARVLLGGVRCAAHTLQLTVHDCIKECNLKKHLVNVRSAVKVLRKFPFKASFKMEKKKLPFLDVETRWNSAFEMVSYFKENETFIKDLLKSNQKEALISKSTWTFIWSFTAVFQPVFIATKKLQEENMTMGDFLFAWETCRLELEDSTSNMAKCLIRHMDRRRVKLFSPPVVAALYLDPRVNFHGSELLTDVDRKVAVDHLLELWNSLKDDQESQPNAPPKDKRTTVTTSSPSTTSQPSKMELFLRRKSPTKSPECLNIEQKLHELSLQPRVSCDDDVLEFWDCKKKLEPELYALAQVALAVPCTQVSVERSFNSLALILSDRRLRLGNANLTNILLVKLNAVLFELIDLKF